jgi:two-component system response regulator AtoC
MVAWAHGPTAIRKLLVVDDEESLRHMLQLLLTREGYEVAAVPSVAQALAELEARPYDAVLCDVRMPLQSGLDLLAELARRELHPTVIMMSAYGNREIALEAMKRGAYDYIAKPFTQDDVVLTLRKAEERERLRRENASLRKALAGNAAQVGDKGIAGLVSGASKMEEVLRTVRKIAEYKTTVLITGESGTGKELIARGLHALSPRTDKPFVAVNCGAIPEALLESELFGHRKGAFTDASRDKRGLFEEADGGTLFLDEIGELPLSLQVKLLRALQEEEIRRLGDTRDVHVDVRVVAATVRDLQADVRDGRFREDLFYRLNVLPIHLPPLRERREDIPLLINHFIAKENVKLGLKVESPSPDAMRLLLDYPWPGNVRELENTMERAMVLCEGGRIGAELLPDKVRETQRRPAQLQGQGELSIKKTARAMEEDLIRRALRTTGGNRTNAARLLEISHRALLYKIKEYGIGDS